MSFRDPFCFGYGRNAVKCCFGCSDRYVGCHSTCETYASAKQETLDTYNTIIKTKKKDSLYRVKKRV